MRLDFKTKIAYGAASIPDQCLFYMYGTFFMFFLTTVAGLSPAAAGAIAASGAVCEGIVSPLAGYISDNTHSPMGKRKPYIVFFSFPAAVFTVLLFTSVDLSPGLKIAYYTFMTLAFWTAFMMYYVPLLTWGSELTADYSERTLLRSYAYFGNTLGLAIGTMFPTIAVDFLMNSGNDIKVSWHYTALAVGALVFTVLVLMPLFIKDAGCSPADENGKSGDEGKTAGKAKDELRKMLGEFAEVLKLKPLRCIIFASVLYLGASTVFASDRMYYFTYNAGISAGMITLLMFIVIASGLVFMPLAAGLRTKFDKRQEYIAGMLIGTIVMFLLRFIESDSILLMCIMMVAFGISNMCYWQLMPAMIYDVCEYDELENGKERNGTIISLQVLSESVSEGVSMLLLGVVLELAGFDETLAVQSTSALTAVKDCYTVIPAVLMLASAFFIFRYPITGKRFDEIRRALESRKKSSKRA